MTGTTQPASPSWSHGGTLQRQGTLVALCLVAFGAALLLVATFLVSRWDARWAWGVGIGGGLGLASSGLAYLGWVRALGSDRLWAVFGRGFLVKGVVLVAGTLWIHLQFAAHVHAFGYAIAFGVMVLWVNLLGLPFLHKKTGSSRG